MKRLLLIAAVIVGLFSAPFTYAAFSDAFLSRQVGTTPANGYVLQTNGTDSTWVDPSTLVGSSLPYYASTTIGDATQTGGLTISGGATTTGNATITGNLGIGTPPPVSTTKLAILGATSNTGISITGVTTGIGLSASNTTGSALSALSLSTGNAVNCTITTTGNCVLFNTTGAAMTATNAVKLTGVANMTADYIGTGLALSATPTRNVSAAATRIHSGNILGIAPLYTTSGAVNAILTLSGTTTVLSRTLSNAATGVSAAINVTAPVVEISNKTIATNGLTDSSNLLSLLQIATSSTGTVFALNSAGSGNLATFNGTGNFGIGTTSPWRKLSVTGTVGFDGLSAGSGTSLCLSSSNELVTCTVSSGASYPFALAGNATSTLTQFNAGLTAFASSTIGDGTQAGGFTVRGGSTTTLNAYFATTLGVGTTTPGGKLSVAATTNAPTPAFLVTGYDNDALMNPVQFIDENNNTDLTIFKDGNTNAGGNIGVGTSTPFSRLTIVNNSTATAGAIMTLAYDSGSLVQNDIIGGTQFYSSDPSGDGPGLIASITANAFAATGNGGYLKFSTHPGTGFGEASAPLERLRIDGNGNVGIGSTTPWGPLSASSTSLFPTLAVQQNSTGPAAIFLGGAVGIGVATPAASSLVDARASDTATSLTGANAATIRFTNTNTTNNNFVAFNLGQINSTGTAVTTVRLAGVQTAHANNNEAGDLAVLTTTAGTIAERLRVTGAGNVGIGTTSPSSALSVQGNSYTSGTAFFGGDITATSTLTLTPLATPAGTFIAADATGKLIATTTPASGGTTYDLQTFTSSGTWTKPSGTTASSTTCIQAWGAGGGGGGATATNFAGGGGGGYYTTGCFLTSALGSTETATVGAGGAAGSTAPGNGGVGGNTSFGSWATAYGGGGGSSSAFGAGGGGGGCTAAGANTTSGTGGAGGACRGYSGGSAGSNSTTGWSGAGGANGGSQGGDSIYGGGGGGGSCNASGNSIWGGGGGYGGGLSGCANTGGSSVYGGAGGAKVDGAGSPGSEPGGGGSGAHGSGVIGGVGANGRLIVTTYK